jgi:hypothetical protein
LNPGCRLGKPSKAAISWTDFWKWVQNGHKPKLAGEIKRYAMKYSHCLVERNLSELLRLSDGLRPHVLKALSNLAKFLGEYETFRELVKSYGLRWRGKSSDDLVIDRLTKVKNSDDVFQWVRSVKRLRPDLAVFCDFASVTGLRYVKAIESYNLIVRLTKEKRLDEYYSHEKEALEHFRFRETFIRRNKKAFLSFVPKEIVERISRCQPLGTANSTQNKVKKKRLPLRFGDIRECHGTVLTRHLNPAEVDFLHGRVSATVFMQNYFNPSLISDLKERTFKVIEEIEKAIKL